MRFRPPCTPYPVPRTYVTVLALSPHLDDAAFSAGGALATWAAAGHEVVVATVFTRSVPRPTGFALRCQTDKGLGPEVDYLALRRDEDAAACARLGARPVWLDLPEAPHRGYDSPAALFGDVRADDRDTWRAVLDRARAVVEARAPDLVVSCQGRGGHVDHRVVVRAAAALADAAGVPAAWWRDAPYALRRPDGPAAPELPGGLAERPVALGGGALRAKLDACAAYASQLPYQFARDAVGQGGGADPEARMRAALRAHALDEGARLGAPGPAEGLATASPDALP